MSAFEKQNTLDRRSFLKVSMLASGALLVGVGYDDQAQASEIAGDTWKPNGGRGMPRG